MNDTPMYYLSLRDETPCSGYWDMGILDCLDYTRSDVRSLPRCDKAIIILPARHHAGLETQVNGELRKIKKVVLFLMGDEEASFDVSLIKHGDISIWVQNPHRGVHDQYNKIGTGYPPQSSSILPTVSHKKINTIFFSGQVTHQRREELKRVLDGMSKGVEAHYSEGFTQGLDHETYYKGMANAFIAPAPSGAVIPDSFRLFEALQSMAIPVADEKCANGEVMSGYWDWMFGEAVPFPTVVDWDRLTSLSDELIANYPSNIHQITSWWLRWKYNFRHKVREQLDIKPENITVVIPTSVLPSHPDTSIIEETIASIRHHLPTSEIILQVDGLRDEQQDRKKDYNRYKIEIIWKSLHYWKNVTPVIFDTLHHQTDMIKATIDMIKTPLLLYVEGDCPLVIDEKIEWDLCIEKLLNGDAYTIRFHHEGAIPKEHDSLMIGVDGKFTKTIQWSQRPMLSTTRYYKDVIIPTLPEKTFIEDSFHGVVQQDWYSDGMQGWFRHRLWIYTPKGNIKRSYTLDGRAGTRKYTTDDIAWGLI